MDELHQMLDLWDTKREQGLSNSEIRQFMKDLRTLNFAENGNDPKVVEYLEWAEAGFPGAPDDHDAEYNEATENAGAEWVG